MARADLLKKLFQRCCQLIRTDTISTGGERKCSSLPCLMPPFNLLAWDRERTSYHLVNPFRGWRPFAILGWVWAWL